MPIWLIRLIPYGVAGMALAFAIWYLDHQGYSRAMKEATAREQERKLQNATMAIVIDRKVGESEDRMQDRINQSDLSLSEKLNKLQSINKTIIQPTLLKEIQSEARFSDPAAGISDGMRGALNTARSLSKSDCPPSSNAVACFALPAAGTADGQLDSNPGD